MAKGNVLMQISLRESVCGPGINSVQTANNIEHGHGTNYDKRKKTEYILCCNCKQNVFMPEIVVSKGICLDKRNHAKIRTMGMPRYTKLQARDRLLKHSNIF